MAICHDSHSEDAGHSGQGLHWSLCCNTADILVLREEGSEMAKSIVFVLRLYHDACGQPPSVEEIQDIPSYQGETPIDNYRPPI